MNRLWDWLLAKVYELNNAWAERSRPEDRGGDCWYDT